MKRFSRLDAARWLYRFLSPFVEQTPLPPPAAWQQIFHIADYGLVLPRLSLALSSHRGNVPNEVVEFLETCLELARLRNDRLRAQLIKICSEFNSVNIKPIIIKGATFLLSEGPPSDSRMMLDLDIWVPDADGQQRAICCLHQHGYQMPENYPDIHHYPPFFCDDELARIELHRDLVHSDYAKRIDQVAAIAGCTDHVRDGIAYRLLDPKTALALSYLQCCEIEKLSTNRGAVFMAKWFDLLDRVKSLGIRDVVGPETLGIMGTANTNDFQLLTALNRLTNLPYSGTQDETYVRLWKNNNRPSDTVWLLWKLFGLLWNSFGQMFELQRWKGKSLSGLGRALINRVKSIASLLWQVRSRF